MKNKMREGTMTIQHGKRRKTVRRSFTLLLTAFVVFASGIFGNENVGAEESHNLSYYGINANEKGTITLTIPTEGEKASWYIENTPFRLYRVAELGNDLKFDFSNTPFKDYPDKDKLQAGNLISKEAAETTAATWQEESTALLEYVRKTYPDNKGLTEGNNYQVREMKNRQVTFNDLGLGLYLIQGDTAHDGNKTVTFQPVLICIPYRWNATDKWNYTPNTEVKHADPSYPSGTPGPSNGPTTTPSEPVTPSPSGSVTPSGTVTPSGSVTPSESVTPSGTGIPSNSNNTPTPTGWNPSATTPGNPPTTPPSGTSSTGPAKLLNVATGDTQATLVYLGIMITAAAVICLAFVIRKKHED